MPLTTSAAEPVVHSLYSLSFGQVVFVHLVDDIMSFMPSLPIFVGDNLILVKRHVNSLLDGDQDLFLFGDELDHRKVHWVSGDGVDHTPIFDRFPLELQDSSKSVCLISESVDIGFADGDRHLCCLLGHWYLLLGDW